MRTSHGSRRTGRWLAWGAVSFVLVVLASGFVLNNLSRGGTGPGGSDPILVPAVKPVTPPGALHIPVGGPTFPLVAGDRLNISVQYLALNYSPAFTGIAIRTPTISGVFPESNGNQLYIPIVDRLTSISGPKWAYLGNSSHILAGSLTLSSSNSPFLTTQKLAVMANTSHGNLRLAFRWHWSVWNPANSTTLLSGWSAFGNKPNDQSTVTPAPLIFLLPTTVTSLTLGSLFVGRLSGLVASQSFYMELEFPGNGSRTAEIREPSPAGISFYNVTILMQYGHGTLLPGPMLVHIHDGYGDILYSVTVTLTSPSSAAVHFKINPGACGPVSFNFGSQQNRSVAHVTTNQSYSASAPACTGYTFVGWSQSGGGAVIASPSMASTQIEVFYNTTVFANYQ